MSTATSGKRKLKKTFQDEHDRLCLGSHLSVAGGSWKAVEEAQQLKLRSLQIFTKYANRWVQRPIEHKDALRFREAVRGWGAPPARSQKPYPFHATPTNQHSTHTL